AGDIAQHRAYTYRPDGHLTAIDDQHAGPRTFDLDNAGRVTAVHARRWTESYAYDEAAYTYRPDGHLTAIDDQHAGPRTFDLDNAGRVTAVHARRWTESYAYDEAGNQTHATWPERHPEADATGDRIYAGTRITRAGDIRYEHDAAGRLT
ncbi:hypothetical protein AB4Z54_66935, partial [Streptomyces sp. MCAF7]